MAKYARIGEDLTVVQFMEIANPNIISPHKKWSDGGLHVRPVVEGERPTFRPELAQISTRYAIEIDRVVIVHDLIDKTRPDQQLAVKSECRRRIIERFPDWKQANMTARSHELDRIQSGFMRDADGNRLEARDLTETEMAEERAIGQAWAWIKAVRAKSDEIEALDPVPADFDADERWSV